MNMQNVKDLSITEGDVRTIHDSSGNLLWGRLAYDTKYAGDTVQNGTPSPATPVPIQVVTGTQTVTVSGKNLFNTGDRTQTRMSMDCGTTNNRVTVNGTPTRNNFGGSYWNLNGTDNANANYYNYDNTNSGTTIPAGTYTLSLNNITGSFTSPSGVFIRVVKVYSGSYPIPTLGSIAINNNESSVTFTLTEQSTIKIQLQVQVSSDTSIDVPVFNNYSFDLQLEAGSSPTSYQAYIAPQTYTINLGSTELAVIGNYADKIYRSGGDWYLHKEIGKVTLDGTETITSWSSGTITSGYKIASITNLKSIVSSSTENIIVSDYFTKVESQNYLASHDVEGFATTETNLYFRLNQTLGSFATWLSTHNTTVYYALATATDTQITDSTLIGQLNAIHEWLTRYGYNSTVSGNLPLLIEQTNLS